MCIRDSCHAKAFVGLPPTLASFKTLEGASVLHAASAPVVAGQKCGVRRRWAIREAHDSQARACISLRRCAMAQCVVCSEDVDVSTAKRFGCCPALYCDACHEETAEGGTCGECFADLTAAAAPPPPPADSTPQLAPAVRPLTPTVFAVAPKPTMVALGTPSDSGTPNPRASGTPAHERLAGDLRRVVLRKVDGNSPRSSPPPVPSPKIVTALQSGALRPTGSDATPRRQPGGRQRSRRATRETLSCGRRTSTSAA